jgi:hypothetical protein
MNIKKIIYTSWLSFFLLYAAQAQALFNVNASIDVMGGYREDKITTLIEAFDPPGVFFGSDEVEGHAIQIGEIGVKGRVSICQWLIKGFMKEGKVYKGHYNEIGEDTAGYGTTSADINKGRTQDFSLGVGYLCSAYRLPWISSLQFGLEGGWSYHSQDFSIKDVFMDGYPDSVLDGLRYKTRWQGPWLGLEAYLSVLCFTVDAGYEYHWAHWHGNWLLEGSDVFGGAYSDRRWAHNSQGNVVFVDVSFSPFFFLEVGVEFRYQYWKGKSGRERPKAGKFSTVGLNNSEVDKIPHTTWESYSVLLYLGCGF